jgi:hypothetical protein
MHWFHAGLVRPGDELLAVDGAALVGKGIETVSIEMRVLYFATWIVLQ